MLEEEIIIESKVPFSVKKKDIVQSNAEAEEIKPLMQDLMKVLKSSPMMKERVENKNDTSVDIWGGEIISPVTPVVATSTGGRGKTRKRGSMSMNELLLMDVKDDDTREIWEVKADKLKEANIEISTGNEMKEILLGSVCSPQVLQQLGVQGDDSIWESDEVWERKYVTSKKEDEEYFTRKKEVDRKEMLAQKVNRRLSMGIEIAKEQANRRFVDDHIDSFVDTIISETREEEAIRAAEEKLSAEKEWLERNESIHRERKESIRVAHENEKLKRSSEKKKRRDVEWEGLEVERMAEEKKISEDIHIVDRKREEIQVVETKIEDGADSMKEERQRLLFEIARQEEEIKYERKLEQIQEAERL